MYVDSKFQVRPELPGVEMAVSDLARRLFGPWVVPLVELANWTTPELKTLPVLISQGVPGGCDCVLGSVSCCVGMTVYVGVTVVWMCLCSMGLAASMHYMSLFGTRC